MKLKPFVISTRSFDLGIGGIKILHKLCDLLNKSNIESYIINNDNFGLHNSINQHEVSCYSKYDTPVAPENLLSNKNDFIAIYPESWYGNHLECKNVIRWILGPTDESRVSTWSDNDIWFWYVPMFNHKKYNKKIYSKNIDNQLYVGEFHRDIFKNLNLNRDTTCWSLRKAEFESEKPVFFHPENSNFIPYNACSQLEQLAYLFNISKQFYCYDAYTFLPIQALMCGCPSVVSPKNEISHDEFINGFILNKYIAYGISDIPRAISIQDNISNNIDLIENYTNDQIKIFAEKCYSYFNS